MIPLWLDAECPLRACRNPYFPDYSHDTIMAIMEFDWYCTGMLGMKQQSCWGILWFFKRPQVSPLK
jgi:hypothetical protein